MIFSPIPKENILKTTFYIQYAKNKHINQGLLLSARFSIEIQLMIACIAKGLKSTVPKISILKVAFQIHLWDSAVRIRGSVSKTIFCSNFGGFKVP